MDMAITVTTVHTSGINLESVLVIVGSSVTILSVLGAMVARYISGKITAAISEFQTKVVNTLADRMTRVETKLDTLNTNNPAHTTRRYRSDT